MMTWVQELPELPTAVIVMIKMTVLLGAGWLLHVALVRRNPRWRVLVWRGVMAGLILLPAGELLLPKLQVPVAPPLPAEEPVRVIIADEPVARGEPDAYVAPVVPAPLPVDAPEAFSIPVWTREHLSFVLLTGWGLIGSILAVRVLCATHRVRRVISASKAAPARIRRAMEKVAADLQCRARVDLRVTADLRSPFLAGVVRPVLVLPERMTDEHHAGELAAVFAHELAHVRTHDLVWILAGKWLSVLLWFHPLVWTVRAAHVTACEQVCDAVAAEYVGGSPTYSQTLARAALELVVDAPALAGIPMIRSSDISRRLGNLKRGIKAAALARPCVAAALVVGCVTLTGLGCLKFVWSERVETDEPRSASEQALEARRYTFGPVNERRINENDTGKDFGIDLRKTIEGRVVDESDRPVAGALVQAIAMNIGGIKLETWTDEDGHFSFTDIIRGSDYGLEFRKPGFGYKTATALAGSAEEVVIVLSSEPTSLSGRVIDSQIGQGVSNARVVLIGEYEYEETALTTTEGYFLFENVAYHDIGQGVIYARNDEDWSEYMMVRGNTREVVLTLDAPGRINGVVTSETSGEPLPGCTVTACPPFISAFAVETTTGEDGTYEFGNLPRGEYQVWATHPEWFQFPDRGGGLERMEITARSDETVFNEIKMHRKATILGRVLGPDNRPARGAVVKVRTALGAYGRESYEIAESDAAGRFTLHACFGRPPEARISAAAEGLGTGSVVVTELKEGEIRDGVEEGAVIKLSGMMRVFGCVRDPAGAPIPGVWVYDDYAAAQSARTDADGRFDLNWFSLPTGGNEQFNVNLRAPRPHFGGLGVVISPAEREPAELPAPGTQYFLHKAVPVTASHNADVELNAVLSPTDLVYFTGQVTDSAGEPAVQASLVLFAGNVPRRLFLDEMNPERRMFSSGVMHSRRASVALSRTVTDKDGRYTICVARESAESLRVGPFGTRADPTLFCLGVESVDGKVKLLRGIRLLNRQKRKAIDIQLPAQPSDNGWGVVEWVRNDG